MDNIDVQFIGERLQIIQTDMRDMRTSLTDFSDGQTVLVQMVFRLERDMVRIKEMLGRIEDRIAKLERVQP